MENLIIIAILILVIGGVSLYLYKSKKRGDVCVGCPYAKQCGGKCSGGCGNPEQFDDKHS